MIALISPAKTMQSLAKLDIDLSLCTKPRFGSETDYIVSLMLQYSTAELSEIFRVSGSLAHQLQGRFKRFYDPHTTLLPAIDSYDGVVYKRFKESINAEYLQSRVRISSLLYGVLRPLDLIQPYRMEGFVRLSNSDERVDKFWRDIQTHTLIDDVEQMGGTLLYLASKEEQNAFNWREVRSKVRVIDFKFLQHRDGKLRQVVVYTKMARGEMIRYMMEQNITDVEHLKLFEWSGYSYNDTLSTDTEWVWLME
ncbi:MAG: YaaA family protein [Rikenellaceae bacterium]